MLRLGGVYKHCSEFRFNLKIISMIITFTDMTLLKGRPKVREFLQ